MGDSSDRGLSGLWSLRIKAPMVRGKFGPHHLQSPLLTLFSSYAFICLRQMSPLSRQPAVFPPPWLKEELNSDPFWVDEATCSALRDETLCLFEGTPTPLEDPAASSTQYLFSSFDDDHLGHPSVSRDTERFSGVDLTLVGSNILFGIQPDNLYVTSSLIPSSSAVVTDWSLSLVS